MVKFCSECGNQLPDGTKFCPQCGAAVPAQTQHTAQLEQTNAAPQYQAPAYAGSGAVRSGIPAPGFSDRVNHPELLAAVKKNKKAAGAFAFFLVPLPFIGFVVYSFFSDKMETGDAVKYGAAVSVIFLIFALYGFIKERAKNTYEAVVIDKKSEWTHRHNSSTSGRERYMVYTTVVRTTDGKKKNIVEHDGSLIWAYNYLNVGDRFKYHPQFNFPYELYDKSKAPYIACVNCTTQNPTDADRCKKCGLPLLK